MTFYKKKQACFWGSKSIRIYVSSEWRTSLQGRKYFFSRMTAVCCVGILGPPSNVFSWGFGSTLAKTLYMFCLCCRVFIISIYIYVQSRLLFMVVTLLLFSLSLSFFGGGRAIYFVYFMLVILIIVYMVCCVQYCQYKMLLKKNDAPGRLIFF